MYMNQKRLWQTGQVEEAVSFPDLRMALRHVLLPSHLPAPPSPRSGFKSTFRIASLETHLVGLG
jgi:hypothetical protein